MSITGRMPLGKLLQYRLRRVRAGNPLHIAGQFQDLLWNGRRAKKLRHVTLGHGARPDVHGDAHQKRRGNRQRRPPQPRCSGFLNQLSLGGSQYPRPQLGAYAARAQSAKQLFDVVVHHGCLEIQVCIFARAER